MFKVIDTKDKIIDELFSQLEISMNNLLVSKSASTKKLILKTILKNIWLILPETSEEKLAHFLHTIKSLNDETCLGDSNFNSLNCHG